MSDPLVPARREGIAEVEIDGEVVLLDTSSGTMHVLNRVAAAVWSELDGKRDVGAVIAALSEAAGADSDRVGDDVRALIEQLDRNGLLAHTPSAAER